jgi:hypothetical protein
MGLNLNLNDTPTPVPSSHNCMDWHWPSMRMHSVPDFVPFYRELITDYRTLGAPIVDRSPSLFALWQKRQNAVRILQEISVGHLPAPLSSAILWFRLVSSFSHLHDGATYRYIKSVTVNFTYGITEHSTSIQAEKARFTEEMLRGHCSVASGIPHQMVRPCWRNVICRLSSSSTHHEIWHHSAGGVGVTFGPIR